MEEVAIAACSIIAKMKDPYINLARKAVETYIKSSKIILPSKNLSPEMITRRAGVFVSLHKKNGSLRGCIGTFVPTKPNIAQEIIANAIAAATQDPRFPPITAKELPELTYSVDILSASKTVSNHKLLHPRKYGLIVSTPDGRRGLLLPDIPVVETTEQQIEICRLKAGISPNERVKLEIFTVERHSR